MATEELVFRLIGDGRSLNDEVDRARKKTDDLGDALRKTYSEQVLDAVDRLRKKHLELAHALSTADAALRKDTAKMTALRQELERTTMALNQLNGRAQAPATKALGEGLAKAAQGAQQASSGLDRFRKVAEPTATAMSGVASAMGGMGGQAGAVGGAVANLASAFAAGGPLAIGLTVASVGVAYLTQKWLENKKAAEEAERANLSAAERMKARLQELTESSKQQAAALKDELFATQAGLTKEQAEVIRVGKLLKQELDAVRFEKEQVRQGIQQDNGRLNQLIAQENQLLELQKAWRDASKAVNDAAGAQGALEQAQERLKKQEQDLLDWLRKKKKLQEDYNRTIEDAEEKTLLYIGALRKQAREEGERRERVVREQTAEAERSAASIAEERIKRETDLQRRLSDMRETDLQRLLARAQAEESLAQIRVDAAQKALEAAAQDPLANHEKLREDLNKALSIEQDAAQRRIQLAEQVAQEKLRIEEQAAQQSAQLIMQFAQIGINATSSFLEMLVTGEEHAAEKMAASALKGIGQQLIGLGTQATYKGVIRLLDSYGTDPTGWGLVAQGGLAIAAGIGMGAAGAGISAAVSSSGQASVGSRGSSGVGRSENPGIRGGSLSDAPTNEQRTEVYVFNAPVYDVNQSARHVSRLQRRARRELLEE